MERIALFERVSPERWAADWIKTFGEGKQKKAAPQLDGSREEALRLYETLKKPARATAGSAGYDLYIPFDAELEAGESIMIPTGFRCRIREDYALFIFPRSSLGFRYRFGLRNTVGIIDSDYYGSDNEGHIFVRMVNANREELSVSLKAGTAFAQGIFLSYGLTEDDEAGGVRNGGMGSTDAR